MKKIIMIIKNIILRKRLGKHLSELTENCANTVSLDEFKKMGPRNP